MVVIATPDPELARRLGELIDGRKIYLLGPSDKVVVDERFIDKTEAESAEEAEARRFRHAIHCAQPEVIVLDVRVGKQIFEAFGQVRRILEVDSAPAIVLLLPRSSRKVRTTAAELGCYDVILMDRRRVFERKVATAVVNAQAARAVGALARKRASESLH